MHKSSQSIERKVLRSIRASPNASVITARQFSRYGNALAVGQALSRLAKAGKIRRIRQGLYDLPRPHPVTGQTAPDPMAAVRALMEGSSAQWQVSGAYAANLLGLSEQVPGRIVVLTNGSPRQLRLDKLTLVFRRAAPRYLLGAGRPAGLVIQAIRHLRARGLEPVRLEALRASLDADTKTELAALMPKLPAWMQPIVQRLTGVVKA
jgi:hypothetical protein